MKRTGSGFTIVELLIVIVVIAILAAITLVSFNGITKQAKDSSILAKVDAYTKILKLYNADNGEFPSVDVAESGLANAACLGAPSDYPAINGHPQGTCHYQGSSEVRTSTTLNSALAQYGSPLPSATLDEISLTSGSITTVYRGLIYIKQATAELQYVLNGEGQKCGRGTAISTSGLTVCVVDLEIK